MARRRIADAQTSRLAVWARRCAFFSLVATLLAIVIVRTGLLEIVPALATFGGALVFAVFGIVLALGAFIVIWKDGIDGGGYAFTALGDRRAAARLPGLSRRARLPAADDQRRHHRSAQSAALRRGGAAAPARHRGLRRALRRRAAARGLSRHRAADGVGDAADRLRGGDRGHHQAQVAHRGRARAAGRPPRRPDRGGGAHPDHGLPRRRRGAHPDNTRRRADRRALGLALRPPRPRRQCLAHPQPAGRRRRGGQRAHRPAGAAQRQKKPPAKATPAKRLSRRSGSGRRSRAGRRSRWCRAPPGPPDAPAPTCRRRA